MIWLQPLCPLTTESLYWCRCRMWDRLSHTSDGDNLCCVRKFNMPLHKSLWLSKKKMKTWDATASEFTRFPWWTPGTCPWEFVYGVHAWACVWTGVLLSYRIPWQISTTFTHLPLRGVFGGGNWERHACLGKFGIDLPYRIYKARQVWAFPAVCGMERVVCVCVCVCVCLCMNELFSSPRLVS